VTFKLILTVKLSWMSRAVIGNAAVRTAIYHFLLAIWSNHDVRSNHVSKAVVPYQNKIILKHFRPEPPPSIDRANFFYFRRGSIMKWNKIILKNFRMFQCFILTRNHVWNEIKKRLSMVTNGGGSGMKFFKIICFNMEPRLKWNNIILAARIILFHFRRDSMLK